MSKKKSEGPCLVPMRLGQTCVGIIHKLIPPLPREIRHKKNNKK